MTLQVKSIFSFVFMYITALSELLNDTPFVKIDQDNQISQLKEDKKIVFFNNFLNIFIDIQESPQSQRPPLFFFFFFDVLYHIYIWFGDIFMQPCSPHHQTLFVPFDEKLDFSTRWVVFVSHIFGWS